MEPDTPLRRLATRFRLARIDRSLRYGPPLHLLLIAPAVSLGADRRSDGGSGGSRAGADGQASPSKSRTGSVTRRIRSWRGRLADYAARFARRYASSTYYTPINEKYVGAPGSGALDGLWNEQARDGVGVR